MIAPTLNEVVPSSSTSFAINWTINNTNYDVIVILTNLRREEISITTVPMYMVNTNIYNVAEGLNGFDNYNVSVATINVCGMMMSDTVTVYGKNYSMYIHMHSNCLVCLFCVYYVATYI